MKRTWAMISVYALALLTYSLSASAQDSYQQWIHANKSDCCDHRDCRPAQVSYTLHGWQVDNAAWPVPHDKVIPWPFGVPYACWGRDIITRRAYVRCLLMDVRM